MQKLRTISEALQKEIQAGLPPDEDASLFGLPQSLSESSLTVLGVPWEPTASYGRGTSDCPERIISASHQLDLYDSHWGNIYRYGIFYEMADERIGSWNQKALSLVERFRTEENAPNTLQREVNELSAQINESVYQKAKERLAQGHWVGLVGGDHSCPLGLMQALAEQGSFGILHFDAHHDLRQAYEGFTYSHASIMYNALTSIPEVEQLVQVGIRDYSFDERDLARNKWKDRVKVFYDHEMSEHLSEGKSYDSLCKEVINCLPQRVYVSFDIDGLDPTLCPTTGTPVPGGLSFAQAQRLLTLLVESGKQIIGFDLCEVGSPKEGEWDLNVGARMLYKLCAALLRSQSPL